MISFLIMLFVLISLYFIFEIPLLVAVICMSFIITLYTSIMAAIIITFITISFLTFGIMYLPVTIIPCIVIGCILAMIFN